MSVDAYKQAIGAGIGTPAPAGQAGSALGVPPPTMTGTSMFKPQGDALSPHAAVSAAVRDLAALKAHFPSGQDRIDGMIAELRGMGTDKNQPPIAAAAPPPPAPTMAPPPPLPPPPMAGGVPGLAGMPGGGAPMPVPPPVM